MIALIAALLTLAAAQADEPAPPPATPGVAIALTENEVRVTSGFTGARLVIYGVAPGFEPGDDLVVLLRGPSEPVTVMRKTRIAGLWLNTQPATFSGAPSYYAAASTRPLHQIAPPDVLRRLGASAEYVPLRTAGVQSSGAAPMITEYRRAIIRLKAQKGLYRNEAGEVTLQEANLFRAEVRLPAQAPVGKYEAQVILFHNGGALAQTSTTLMVHKAGVGETVYNMAQDQPFLYGLLAVAAALLAGWLAAAIFARR